jgi:hypothetical protein
MARLRSLPGILIAIRQLSTRQKNIDGVKQLTHVMGDAGHSDWDPSAVHSGIGARQEAHQPMKHPSTGRTVGLSRKRPPAVSERPARS